MTKRGLEGSGREVVIYSGGGSPERETSLASGRVATCALKGLGYTVHSLELDGNARAALAAATRYAHLQSIILLHGGLGEDGSFQAVLETQGTPFSGSRTAPSAFAMNKHVAKCIFRAGGLLTPNWRYFSDVGELQDVTLEYSAPTCVKAVGMGSSYGIFPIHSQGDVSSAIHELKSGPVILEDWVSGRIVTVGIADLPMGTKVLSPVEIIPTKSSYYDQSAKYYGDKYYGYLDDLDDGVVIQLKEAALSAHRLLGLSGLSRADFILDNGKIFVLEINTIPGLGEKGNFVTAAQRDGHTIENVAEWLVQSIR